MSSVDKTSVEEHMEEKPSAVIATEQNGVIGQNSDSSDGVASTDGEEHKYETEEVKAEPNNGTEESDEPGQKRKAEDDGDDSEEKKAKLDVESVTVFVGNMDPTVTEEMMKELFTSASIDVISVRRHAVKAFGYVDIHADDSEKAVALNGTTVGESDKKLTVELARGKRKPPKMEEKDKKTLFVKNLAPETTAKDLMDEFPTANSIRAPKKADGTSRGFAFLEFQSEEEVEKLKTEKAGLVIREQEISLDFVGTKSEHDQKAEEPRVLFVKNLGFNTTAEDLESTFKNCKSTRIVKDKTTDQSKGYGFVVYETPEAAKEGYDTMQGVEIDGRVLAVDYDVSILSRRNRRFGRGFGRGGRGRGGRGRFRGRGRGRRGGH